MIPPNIDAKHILAGIQRTNEQGFPSNRTSDIYELSFNGLLYPPKVVISYANFFANNVDHPSSKFSGGDETNHFLMDRGFPIMRNTKGNPENFFTQEDLYFFNQAIQHGYDANDTIDQNKAEYIKQYLWGRSKIWADLLATDGGFKVTGRTQWNDRGEGGQGFKKYSWYKLHLTSEFHSQIFYTVGVDARDKALVIKLDCQRSGSDRLYLPFQQYFDAVLKSRGIVWKMFYQAEIEDSNWHQLITESQVFISETIHTYREVITYIKNHRVTKYARICWNDYGWIKPSGFSGKSVTAQQSQNFIHERENGFAPEEWLFDLDKTIDGYHYARIEPVHTKNDKHVHQVYDLIFYTFNSILSQWFWVGEIKEVEVLSPTESVQVYSKYRRNRWLLEQQHQLEEIRRTDEFSVNLNVRSFTDWEPDDLFNIRFKPEQVWIYPELQLFKEGEKPPSNHYNLPDADTKPAFVAPSIAGGLMFEEVEDEDVDDNPTIRKIRRNYSAGLRELINVHYELQKAFIHYLKINYPDDKIGKECTRIGYNTRVDVVRRTTSGDIFYEIKTYPDVLTSVRVALGQLLEYQFYPNQKLARNLIIVTHLPAEPIIYDYLKQIKKQIGIGIGLICFDYKTNTIISTNVIK